MWYCLIGDNKNGPFSTLQAAEFIRRHPGCMVWREGMPDWMPAEKFSILTTPEAADDRGGMSFRISGENMQYVEIDLAPGESVIAEPGSMIYKEDAVILEAMLDGNRDKGFFGRLAGAGKRIISGERAFLSVFSNSGRQNAKVAFSAPFPGKIIPVSLNDYNGEIVCQKSGFLCARPDTEIGVYFQKKVLTALFGGGGFIMQRLSGNGVVFIHAGGSVAEFDLNAGETVQADAGCLVAFTPTVDFSIQDTGSFKSQIFGGSGLFFATLKGPGKVWIQSLPFVRLVQRIAANLVVKQK